MMKHVFLLRIAAVLFAGMFLFLLGCTSSTETEPEPSAQESSGAAEYIAESTVEPAELQGALTADDAALDVSSGGYASGTADEPAVLAQNGGSLALTNTIVEKTGDSDATAESGKNAAVAALSGASVSLSDCIVVTGARGAAGLFVSGEISGVTATGTSVSTAGGNSPPLAAADGGAIFMIGGSLSAADGSVPLILLSGGGRVSLDGVSLAGAGDRLVFVLSGDCELTANAQTLSGEVAVSEDASFLLTLQNGSVFTGALGGSLPARVSVTLDATSRLSLTADTSLSALINEDGTHQNIESNGYFLYYDANLPENTYLHDQSFALPGGGYLAPMI